MKKVFFKGCLLVICMIAAFVVGMNFYSTSSAIAKNTLQYKLVQLPSDPSTGMMDITKYESVLNKMAGDGWIYDHGPNSYYAVFKK